MKKITVCIINHNYNEYLEQAIISVLWLKIYLREVANSGCSTELIVVDDHSKEDPRDIVGKYYVDDIDLYIRNASNLGLIKSFNKAIKISSGDYIIRLDADDHFSYSEAAKAIKEAIKEDKDITYFDFINIAAHGAITEKVSQGDYEYKLANDIPFHGSCLLVKREAYEKIGYYDEEFDCQDGYYLFRQDLTVAHIARHIFFYRKHPKSLSSDTYKVLKTRDRIREKYPRK